MFIESVVDGKLTMMFSVTLLYPTRCHNLFALLKVIVDFVDGMRDYLSFVVSQYKYYFIIRIDENLMGILISSLVGKLVCFICVVMMKLMCFFACNRRLRGRITRW